MLADISNLTLSEFLAYLAGPLGIAAFMLYLSNAVRNLLQGNLARMSPSDQEIAIWLRGLRPLKVQAIVTAIALGVPILAHTALTFVPADVLERLQPTFAFITKLLAIYLLQQVWYQITKQPEAGELPAAAEQVPPITVHAPIQIVPGNAPSGPGAIAPGVTSEPYMIAELIPVQVYSDMDLRRIRIAIDDEIQRRGSVSMVG